MSGVILILVGVLIFARKLGMILPDWLFCWQTFLIALGFYIGAKHNFRNPGWIILVGIGSFFLLEHFFPEFNVHEFFWPVLLIGFGVFVIIKPKKHGHWKDHMHGNFDPHCMEPTETNENKIAITAIMGGVRKNVLSKEFQGGEITAIMGGAEVNLIQADINGKVELQIENIFGGTKLLIPNNWVVVSEVMVVLGGIEDKRPVVADAHRNAEKILVIKGNCIFGGIDIKSY